MPIPFPGREDGLPESSRQIAVSLDLATSPESRGFIFNAEMESLVQFLNTGTRGPSNLR